MSDRYEVRCDRCGLLEVITPDDAPDDLAPPVYAEYERANHSADCIGATTVGCVPDVNADTTKYTVGGEP